MVADERRDAPLFSFSAWYSTHFARTMVKKGKENSDRQILLLMTRVCSFPSLPISLSLSPLALSYLYLSQWVAQDLPLRSRQGAAGMFQGSFACSLLCNILCLFSTFQTPAGRGRGQRCKVCWLFRRLAHLPCASAGTRFRVYT
jgi:hypothetical protein